jgi:hypothetical protein
MVWAYSLHNSTNFKSVVIEGNSSDILVCKKFLRVVGYNQTLVQLKDDHHRISDKVFYFRNGTQKGWQSSLIRT